LNLPTYDPNWGVPIAILPSLRKDYQKSLTIETTWAEFRKALRRAKKVLVLGHSLHDVELLLALGQEVQPYERIGFTHPGYEPSSPEMAELRVWWSQLLGSRLFQVYFGPSFDGSGTGFEGWDDAIDRALSGAA